MNEEFDVAKERTSQDRKWGVQNHTPERWLVILGEEYGEACKEALEGNLDAYRHELVQTAAVAMAAIDSLDRARKEGGEK
jgi:hypothetical protein